MNTIRFKVGERHDPGEGTVDAITVFVNGRNLGDVLREVELPLATSLPALAPSAR